MGGNFHLKLNIDSRPIANKYREGKVKRTLEFIAVRLLLLNWKARVGTVRVGGCWKGKVAVFLAVKVNLSWEFDEIRVCLRNPSGAQDECW